MFPYCLWLFCAEKIALSSLHQNPDGPQSRKYLLSRPLPKKFADSRFRLKLEISPYYINIDIFQILCIFQIIYVYIFVGELGYVCVCVCVCIYIYIYIYPLNFLANP